MNGILSLNPDDEALNAAAGIMGQLSGPQRMPVSLGSILGQAGAAANSARQKAVLQNEQLAQTRMMREAQAADLAEKVEARKQATAVAEKTAKAKTEFNSILGELQASGQPLDEISILGAGIKSGAFGPRETTEFMSKVMERKAKREDDMKKEEMRIADRAASREEREAAERRLVQLRGDIHKENMRLAAALRPPPQDQIITSETGIFSRGRDGKLTQLMAPDGTPLKPTKGADGKLTELEAKGTVFMRQMDGAERAIRGIVGPDFDLSKLGNVTQVRMAGSDLTNWASTPNAQKYNQAAEQWAEAYLRVKTGAAATDAEVKKNVRTFFPQPGDSAAVVKQKDAARKAAIEDVSIMAGRGVGREPSLGKKDPWE